MPITLNGSGTVTGISAGGLPDGCIQSADLASGVGGKVLQVVQSVKTDTVSGSVDAGAVTGFDSTFNGTITPSSTSSLIYITGFVNVAVSGNVSNVSIVYRRNSSNLDTAVNGSGTTTCLLYTS